MNTDGNVEQVLEKIGSVEKILEQRLYRDSSIQNLNQDSIEQQEQGQEPEEL